MALKPETEAWLKSLPLSKEVSEALTKELEADHEKETKVRETVLGRSEINRKFDELAAKEKEQLAAVEAAQQKANGMLDANVKWRKENEAVVVKALENQKKLESKLAATQAKLKLLADQGVIDPGELDKDEPTITAKTPETRGMTQEEVKKFWAERESELGRQVGFALANFGDLADEHFRLFGTHLKRTDLMKEVAEKNISLEEAWENKFKVAAKRTELAETQRKQELDQARQEERLKVLSEISVSPGGVSRGESLDDGMNKHILNIVKPTNDGGGLSPAVQAAKASWAKHEFAEKTPA
jgi:hypothetical protein